VIIIPSRRQHKLLPLALLGFTSCLLFVWLTHQSRFAYFCPCIQNSTIWQAGISYELICQRRLECRLRDTRHVSGHIAHITVYEEAKGVFLYNVYLAHNSARAQLKVDSRLLESVLPDTCVTSGEREAVASGTAERLVAPITDRLVISPSRTTFATIGFGSRNRNPLFSRQGVALKIRSKVYNLHVTTQG